MPIGISRGRSHTMSMPSTSWMVVVSHIMDTRKMDQAMMVLRQGGVERGREGEPHHGHEDDGPGDDGLEAGREGSGGGVRREYF